MAAAESFLLSKGLVLFLLAAPFGFVLAAAWPYSYALIRGLAAARDESNRVTPEGPWLFFDREYLPRERRVWWMLAIAFVGDLALLPALDGFRCVRTGARFSETFGFTAMRFALAASMAVWLAGVLGSALALWAPKFTRPSALAATGTLSAAAFLGTLVLGFYVASIEWLSSGFRLTVFGCCLLALWVSTQIFTLTWKDIRAKRDNSWFGFPE